MFGRELNILFWNLNKKELSEPIIKLVKRYYIDILIVVESQGLNKQNLLHQLNTNDHTFFDANEKSLSNKICFFTSFDPVHIIPVYEDDSDRFSIRKLNLPEFRNLIIGGLHLLDQRNYSESSRGAYANLMKKQIEELEEI